MSRVRVSSSAPVRSRPHGVGTMVISGPPPAIRAAGRRSPGPGAETNVTVGALASFGVIGDSGESVQPRLRSVPRTAPCPAPAPSPSARSSCCWRLAPFLPRGASDPSGPCCRPARTDGTPPGRARPPAPAPSPRRCRPRSTAWSRPGRRARPAGRASATPDELVAGRLVRCADLEGQRYCLGVGWTDSSAASEVRCPAGPVAASTVAERGADATSATGDLDALAPLRRSARLDPTERAAAERARAHRGRPLGGQGLAAAARARGRRAPGRLPRPATPRPAPRSPRAPPPGPRATPTTRSAGGPRHRPGERRRAAPTGAARPPCR